MVIKVYTSGISGNKEVKKRQQRILMIMDSKNIDYEAIDITEPGKELEKQFMQDNAKAKDSKHPLPPQIFNEDDYCGDYEGFDLANENDELEVFLKLPLPPTPAAPVPIIEPPPPVVNGTTEHSDGKESSEPTELERNDEIINNMVPNSIDIEPKKEQANINSDDALDNEEKQETEPSVNEELDADGQNGGAEDEDEGVGDE